MVNDELNEMYEEIVMDHYHNPRHTENLESPKFEVEKNNPFCGDEIKIQINLLDNQKVSVSVTGRGCAISQASASLLAELVDGKSTGEVQAAVDCVRRLLKGEDISDEEADILGDIEALGGVRKFPVRIKCALLSWVGLDDGLKEHLA